MPAARCARSAATTRRSRASTARWRSIRTIVKAHNNRGAVLEALNRIDEALACYDRALALAPDFTEARNNRGRVLIGLDRADDAIENFTVAIRVNPGDAEAWYQRGRNLLDIGRNDEAAADLAQALALHPDHAEARFAACIAELPVIYADESEIPRRRAAYEQKLRALSKDVDAGLLQGNLIKAIGAKQPFLLAYQGGNDRALQQIYGEMVYPHGGASIPAGAAARTARAGRADPRRHRQQLLLQPLQLENSDQGLDEPARSQPVPRDRLSPRRHARCADRRRRRPVRQVRAPHSRHAKAGGGQSLPTRRMC